MHPEVVDHLSTVRDAVKAILAFVADMTLDDYVADKKTRYSVERAFEIIGEALSRIKRSDPAALEAIPDHRSIISFRNLFAHGYDHIEDRIVWGIIEGNLPHLLDSIDRLLQKPE